MTAAMLAIAIAFLAPLAPDDAAVAQEPGAGQPAQLAAAAVAPGDVRLRGRDLRHLPGARSRARSGTSRWSGRAVRRATSWTLRTPRPGLITWQGSWRTLEQSWTLAPQWQNYADVWNLIDFPRLLFNTIALAIIGTIGTVISCTLVAYGFARFRFPGRGLLFTLLIMLVSALLMVGLARSGRVKVARGHGADAAASVSASEAAVAPAVAPDDEVTGVRR